MTNDGIVVQHRDPMKGQSMFYDFYGYRDTDTTPGIRSFKRERKLKNELFISYPGWDEASENQDTVKSFRTIGSSDLPRTSQGVYDMLKETNPSISGDTGHEFDLRKYYAKPLAWRYVHLEDYFRDTDGYKRWGYRGPLAWYGRGTSRLGTSSFNGMGVHGYVFSELADVDIALGARAIAQVAPGKSEANIAASLLELRDGFPKAIGKALRNGRDASAVGDEFLNIVFGWLPTISDVKQIAVAMVNARKIITQYERDADRIVRRRFRYPIIDNTKTATESAYGSRILAADIPVATTNNMVGFWGQGSLYAVNDNYNVTLAKRNKTSVWFSGAFRYHLATGDDVFSRIDRTGAIAAKWLGARLDARAFWQAMPWSWFIDWFTDVGAIVDNANAAGLDGQVLQYGYLMRHDVVSKTFTTESQVTYDTGLGLPIQNFGNLATTFVSERKQRVKATPYGFGLNPESFSAQQWAILAALGLTKSPNRL